MPEFRPPGTNNSALQRTLHQPPPCILSGKEDAGLRLIDLLITTHWHGDHYGGLSELASRIPIGHYIDHGPTVEDNETVQAFIEGDYRDLYGAARRTVVKPGDVVPLSGLDVKVVASSHGSRS